MEKVVESWDQRKMWRMVKKMTDCAKSAMVLDGEISKYFDMLQVAAQGCTLSPTLFKIFIDDLIIAVEAASKESRWGKIWCQD